MVCRSLVEWSRDTPFERKQLTINELLEVEAEKLTQAARYERNEQRQGYCSGDYGRNLTATSGDVTLKVPKLKGVSFVTAIIVCFSISPF